MSQYRNNLAENEGALTTPRCEHTLFVEDTRYQAGPSPVCVAWTDPEAARLTVTGNDAAPQQLLLLTIVADTRNGGDSVDQGVRERA